MPTAAEADSKGDSEEGFDGEDDGESGDVLLGGKRKAPGPSGRIVPVVVLDGDWASAVVVLQATRVYPAARFDSPTS